MVPASFARIAEEFFVRGVPRGARTHAGAKTSPIPVVDDDPQTLRLVRQALTGVGYPVVETGDPNAWNRSQRPSTSCCAYFRSTPGGGDRAVAASPGVGRAGLDGHGSRARVRQEAARQARRQRLRSRLDLQCPRRRLPNVKARRGVALRQPRSVGRPYYRPGRGTRLRCLLHSCTPSSCSSSP